MRWNPSHITTLVLGCKCQCLIFDIIITSFWSLCLALTKVYEVLTFIMIVTGMIDAGGVGRLLCDGYGGQKEALPFRTLFILLLFNCIPDRFRLLLLAGFRRGYERSLKEIDKHRYIGNGQMLPVDAKINCMLAYMSFLIQLNFHILSLMTGTPRWIDNG